MKKTSKLLLSLFASISASSLFAASVTPLWEPLKSQLNTFQVIGNPSHKLNSTQFSQSSAYQLNYIYQNKTNGIAHQRFQLRYQGLDVFGYHTLLHHYPNHKTMVTGHLIKGIEKDVPTLAANYSAPKVLAHGLKSLSLTKQSIKLPNTQKVIFIDPKTSKAHLAYLVSFFTTVPSQPMLIMDATTGNILKQWNNLKSEKSGLGPGGNSASIGALTYMSSPSNNLELPPFDVSVSGSTYSMSTSELEVRDYNASNSTIFPISIANEDSYPSTYSFTNPTNNSSGQLDEIDGYNFHPNNDVMFHAGTTIDMLKDSYGLAAPIGTDIPLRIYTRVQGFDNALSYDTIKTDNVITSHQQLVIGNGSTVFYPLSMGTVAHELCHNLTSTHSNMVYAEQSGGMNEAFSDMCELALYHRLRSQGYTWYWGGTDYHIGSNETQSGFPLRYFNDPRYDGNSIGSANDYTDSLDVHYSSGVFNKAFYHLAVTYGLTVQNAFQYMGNANYNYWVPLNTFAYGACGVIQSAYDANVDHTNYIKAFSDVDVECKLFKLKNQVMKNKFVKEQA